MFENLHLLFETQYTDLSLAVDLVAERIRALDFPVPASFLDFSELATIKESRETLSANKMLEISIANQEALIRTIRIVANDAAKAKDDGTYDILVQRIKVHEKNAWMLRSSLSN